MNDIHDPSPKYVILRGLKHRNRFITSNDKDDPRILADGSVGYEILAYANSIREAQVFLYGRSFCDHDE